VAFNSTGARAEGRTRGDYHEKDVMYGTIEGGIDGYRVNFDVRWDDGPRGKYEGSVDANGFASGITYDARNPASTATWHSNGAFVCITAAAS
jgi:hypothetical protein